MASVNKVILVGNLGRDPEVRHMPNGDPVANIALATSSKYKGQDGNAVEETEWHRVAFFGKLAEIVGQYLKKGSSVYIEGRLKTRKYTDKDGVEKYATDIIASQMQMIGGRKDNEGNEPRPSAPPARQAPPPRQAQAPRQQTAAPAATGFDDFEDDIPF